MCPHDFVDICHRLDKLEYHLVIYSRSFKFTCGLYAMENTCTCSKQNPKFILSYCCVPFFKAKYLEYCRSAKTACYAGLWKVYNH